MRTLTVEQGEGIGVASRDQGARPQPVSSVAANRLAEAEREFENALFGHADGDVILAAGRAYGAAREASETIDQRAFRLGLRAADKDAEAERHLAAAADAAGMAAGRRLRWGQDDPTAASLQREADHCTALAEEADAEAYRLRSQAAALRRADIAQRKVA